MPIPQAAITSLGDQILRQARCHVPQGWHGVSDARAPSTIEDMRFEWYHSIRKYPVSHDYCDATIYETHPDGGQCINMAFRAWHDALHVAHGYTTSENDENELGVRHVKAIHGIIERAIMLVDTVGQTQHFARFGEFPADQAAWANFAYPFAILAMTDGKEATNNVGSWVIAMIDAAQHAPEGGF